MERRRCLSLNLGTLCSLLGERDRERTQCDWLERVLVRLPDDNSHSLVDPSALPEARRSMEREMSRARTGAVCSLNLLRSVPGGLEDGPVRLWEERVPSSNEC